MPAHADETPLVEAARRLGIDRGALQRAIARGELRGRSEPRGLLRRSWYVATSEIERIERERTRDETSD